MKVNDMTNYRKSNEIKIGLRRKMREGRVWLNCTRFLGYTKDENGHLVIVEDEAKIVRKIFELYLNGLGGRKIKKYLEENRIKTVTGKSEWSTSTIDRILDNEKYVGDVIMQKSFTENSLTGKRKKNTGELDMYFIENDHEPIVSREDYKSVQAKKRKSTRT
ncbi:recombinase family protein [Ruminococcus flavefaciens]|uniref:recombinase family protein n=1 Tax=Ruminococcus flavefaciens TaxID=1265 RepID=UPI0026EBD54C|nr:recombinase family protein [Ruminococcus flavefaciens]